MLLEYSGESFCGIRRRLLGYSWRLLDYSGGFLGVFGGMLMGNCGRLLEYLGKLMGIRGGFLEFDRLLGYSGKQIFR